MRNHIRITTAALFALGLSALLAGCSGGGGGGDDDGSPDVSGAWQYTSGALFPEVGGLTYLEFRADGSGTVFGSSPSGVLACGAILYATISQDVLELTVPAIFDERLLRFERTGNTLTLIDVYGSLTVFTRADAVPAAAQCGTVTVSSRNPLPDGPNGGLTFDGTTLYYRSNDDVIVPVDATTFTAGTPLNIGSNSRVFAMQGTDFWGTCGCGDSREIFRTTPGGATVDAINTDTDLVHHVGVRTAAWDGSRLWLYGQRELVRVDSNVEPDVLDSVTVLDFDTQTIEFEAGEMWAIVENVGSVLVSFDPATGDVSRTLALPPGNYRGLVVTGTTAHLLAATGSGSTAEIIVVTLP